MCGIFGLILGPESRLETAEAKSVLAGLFRLSESRGKEAAGLAVRRQGQLLIHKQALSAGRMLATSAYSEFIAGALAGRGAPSGLIAIGHSRLVTNGSQLDAENNQPCASEKMAIIHNGIIVNDADLWKRHPDLERRGEVDTEVLLRLIESSREESLAAAVAKAFGLIQGSASIALAARDSDALILATNTGSLHFSHAAGIGVFASERYILAEALKMDGLAGRLEEKSIHQIKAGEGLVITPDQTAGAYFRLGAYPVPAPEPARFSAAASFQPGLTLAWEMPKLRRCVKCILPETMPFVEFDADGICHYCRTYRPAENRGLLALEEILASHRSHNGDPDCIVALSGGRDSSYGLHYLKQELGMNPIAYSYDWGMVTDLGRRNQARMCGQLGVEHILISADIRRKRDNIRRNIEAWLRKPHLGMIPLFMAGDKHFFYHANRLKEKTGIKLIVFCENPLEKTNFKTGFLGVREGGQRLYDMARLQQLKLNLANLREFIRNPSYLNRSLLDTALGFGSAYLLRHDYLFLFRYIPWHEQEIDSTLLGTYDWETCADTPSTWRIGDGTAAFYNYIYSTVAGFSEFDTFRSNQIREGVLTREQALALVAIENRPRLPSMRAYAELAGFDLDLAMHAIQSIPKLHAALGNRN